MRSRKSQSVVRPASISTRIDPFILLSRRRSPLQGRVSPRVDLLPLSVIYSPYALAYPQHWSMQRRRESREIRSGRLNITPTEKRPASLLKSPNKRQKSPLRKAVKLGRNRYKTPSPAIPQQPEEPVIKIHREDSQENVLQTPAEDQPTNPSGSLYEPEIKRSLEEYLASQTNTDQTSRPVKRVLLQLPSLESVAPTTDSKSSHDPSNESDTREIGEKRKEGLRYHRRLLLSGSLYGRSLTPTPVPPAVPRPI